MHEIVADDMYWIPLSAADQSDSGVSHCMC